MPSSIGLQQPPRSDSPMAAVPHLPLKFDNTDADSSALRLAYAFEPSWEKSEGPVDIVRFTDGITNTLTKATKKRPGKTVAQNDEEAVLMRAYGKDTDVLIDRERELRAHTLLASRGLAPPLLARFDNGLMYRYVQGSVCTPEDLRKPHVYRAVAKRLGEWHGGLPISAITSTPKLDDPVQRKHCGLKDGNYTRPFPNIWTLMENWIHALPSKTEAQRQRIVVLEAELQELSDRFGDIPGLGSRDFVFAHCDLLSGNVIIQGPSGSEEAMSNGNSEERPVSFIDYEYSTPAPAAFDIANHFAEWAGFDCDHGAVPTKSQRRDFIKSYVGSFYYHMISEDDNIAIEIDMKTAINQLYDQVDMFRGVPGFFWGIWALIQAMISQIDFDYASYAELRLGEYWSWKAECDGSRQREGKEMPLRERRWSEE